MLLCSSLTLRSTFGEFVASRTAEVAKAINTLLLLLAFLAFVAAAVGWRYRKINLIAIGLALWMLYFIIP